MYLLVKFTLHKDKGAKLMSKIIDAILCKGLPVRDIKNANRVNLLALLWAVTLLFSAFAKEYSWYHNTLAISITFIVHMAIGIVMVFSFRKFLKELDDLERKIQLDALALSVGVTIISFSGSSILSKAGVIEKLDQSSLIVVMSVGYMVGLIFGRIKYR